MTPENFELSEILAMCRKCEWINFGVSNLANNLVVFLDGESATKIIMDTFDITKFLKYWKEIQAFTINKIKINF